MSLRLLSGLDATFLYLEKPEMPMHVGAMHVLEMPPGYRGRFVSDLRNHIGVRLPAAPMLRRRVWWMPLNMANPAWVDAEPDLNWHITEHRLPRTAANADAHVLMEAQVSKLHPNLLDRSRPLWRMHVIEGLPRSANGNRQVGIYTQLHHAAVDGQAAVALGNVLFDLTPEPRTIELRPSKRHKVFRHDMVEMLRGALTGELAQVGRMVQALPATLSTVAGTARNALNLRSLLAGGSGNVTLAPATPMNVTVTTQRAFASASVPMRELRALAQAHQVTLNDLVLMLCSGALRSYLKQHNALPRKSLVAAVPITLRQPGDTRSDNQASMSLISLGTHLADPARRLAHIRAASTAMKATMGRMKSVLPTDFPSIGVPWLMEAAATLYGKARVAERLPQVANVVISNVPGPQVPLYLAGARVTCNHPTSIVVHGMALNITVQSFDASMDFGLMADGTAMPDVKALALAVNTAFEELCALPPAEVKDAAAAPPPAKARASAKKAAPATPARKAKPAAKTATASRKRPAARAAAPKRARTAG